MGHSSTSRIRPPCLNVFAITGLLACLLAIMAACKSPVTPPAAVVAQPAPAAPVAQAVPDAGQPVTAASDAGPSDTPAEAGDDDHHADRQRGLWTDPCSTGEDGPDEKPANGHDGRAIIDMCSARTPFPKSIDHDLENMSRGIGYLELHNGAWLCWTEDQPEGETYNCGGIDLNDVIYVDVDRDGRMEVIAHYMVTYGGNCESYFIYAYEIVGKKPRFKGDLVSERDFYSCEYKSLDRLEPFGKHCVKAVANCDKNCHGCDGVPCYDVFAWTGKGFEIAESWMDANPDNHTEPGVTQDAKLLKLCGI